MVVLTNEICIITVFFNLSVGMEPLWSIEFVCGISRYDTRVYSVSNGQKHYPILSYARKKHRLIQVYVRNTVNKKLVRPEKPILVVALLLPISKVFLMISADILFYFYWPLAESLPGTHRNLKLCGTRDEKHYSTCNCNYIKVTAVRNVLLLANITICLDDYAFLCILD